MAETPFEHLFTPFTLRKLTVRNRIVVPGHATLYMPPGGLPTERQLQYWLAKARGGVGLIITHNHAIMPATPEGPPVGIQREEFVSAYRPVVEALHAAGTGFLLQLNHAGAAGAGRGTGPVSLAPSAVRGGAMGNMPREMTKADIAAVLDAYRLAASQARECGFDGVEIQGEVSFLVAQFMSASRNTRDDEYGGNLENRLRFAREVIEAVREGLGPDLVAGIRLSGDEFVDGGLTLDDMLEITPLLEATGELDFMHIGSGPGGAGHIPPSYYKPGSFVYLTEAIRKVVDLPLICSQRINDPLIAERVVAAGSADLISMNRAIMADPEMPTKAREGRLDEIRKCIACNECIGRFRDGLPIACTVNPEMGREQQLAELTEVETPRRVMVVGGGPAGLEAALVAALRGHQVSVYERGPELGGQTLLAAAAPGREEMGEIRRYYSHQLASMEVEIHLNTDVTPELIERESPDVVLIATGSTAFEPEIETSDGAHVIDARDVLAGDAQIGERVVVVAGEQHIQALSVADYLADRGHEVELLTPSYSGGALLEAGTRDRVTLRLLEAGVTISPLTEVSAVRGRTVSVVNTLTHAESAIEGIDTVVVAFGGRADDTLARSLEGDGREVHLIGDAFAPRRLMDAIYEGTLAARRI